MSNVYGINILKDETQHTVIKLTGKFDGTGQEENNTRIVANSLYGALATNGFPVANVYGGAANTALSYYGLSVSRIWYDCPVTGDIELTWSADASNTIMCLNGSGDYNSSGDWVVISNPTAGTANSTGNINVSTRGMGANTGYTIVIELRKDNAYYQRGQFNDPAAFNYGTGFALRP